MLFRQLFEAETSTYTYLLADEVTKEAILIDPVKETVPRDTTLLRELGLTLRYSLETHVHADHVTGSGLLREQTGAKTCVAEKGGAPCADVPLKDGDTVRFGNHVVEVRATPGHTDGCLTYVVRDGAHTLAFTGDALLIRGCGRTDFQQGDSKKLYRSVHDKIYTLPDDTLIYPGHDYQGRTVSTVGEEKLHNARLALTRAEDDFVTLMANLKLAAPKKIHEAVPANLHCGIAQTPAPEPHDARPAPVQDTSAWAPIVRSPTGVPEVSPAWVKSTLGSGAYTLVDVREADELLPPPRGLGQLQGARHLPLATTVQAMRSWDHNAPVVVMCRSGGRSGRAALDLEAAGFTHVASMQGGLLNYGDVKTTPASSQ